MTRIRRAIALALLGMLSSFIVAVSLSSLQHDSHRFQSFRRKCTDPSCPEAKITKGYIGYERIVYDSTSERRRMTSCTTDATCLTDLEHRVVENTSYYSSLVTSERSGWPMRSFVGFEITWVSELVVYSKYKWMYPPLVRPLYQPSNRYPLDDYLHFPYRPLPLGLAINTLFYALLWFVLFRGLKLVRTKRRLRRGLCPNCAYDLQHTFTAPCPECGWHARPHNPRAPASAPPPPDTIEA